MPGIRLTFDMEGERQVDRTLEGIADHATDASPAFERMGDQLATFETRQFDSEGAAGSGGWAPLSPRYAAWKARHHPGKPIMELTGATRDSLTHRPFGVDVVLSQSAVFGSGLDYPRYHQAGAGNLPRRPVIDLPESVRRDWVKTLQRWLVTGRL